MDVSEVKLEQFIEELCRIILEDPDVLEHFIAVASSKAIYTRSLTEAALNSLTMRWSMTHHLQLEYPLLADIDYVLEQGYSGPLDDEFTDHDSLSEYYKIKGIRSNVAVTLAESGLTPLRICQLMYPQDLLRLSGIGPKTLEAIQLLVSELMTSPDLEEKPPIYTREDIEKFN